MHQQQQLETVGEEVIRLRNIYKGQISDERVVELVNKRRDERFKLLMDDIPLEFKEASIPDIGYKGDELFDGFKEIFSAGEETFGLLLTGPVGVGKTFAMYAMWKWIAEYDPAMCWFFENYAKYMQKVRQEFVEGTYENQGSWWELSTNKKYRGVLMIDDVGTSKYSDFELEKLYLLLDERTSWRLPTIISTNIGYDDLGSLLGDRVASRLRKLKRVDFLDLDMRNENNK